MGGGRFLFRLVFGYRFCELIGAGSAVSASDAAEKRLDIVDILAAAGIDRKTSGTIGPEEYSLFFDRLTTALSLIHISEPTRP